MRTAVLILSVDEAHLLAHSLPAARQDGAELVVIDNACVDGTAALAAEHGARVVALPARESYAAAMNAGLAAVDADAVLILNADCFLQPGFLAAAVAPLADPAVGSVAPKLLRTPAPDAAAAPTEIDAAGMFVNRRRRNGLVGHGAPAAGHAERRACFGADGACALYRTATLRECALPEVFDPDMGLWATDADLAWRAQLLGWRCVYEPAAVARHIRTYSKSTRAGLPPAHRRLQFRNRYVMWCKNETPAGLRDAPLFLAWELLALGYVLLRERHLLRGYAEALRALPAARRRRRLVQARRRVARPPF